jgi:hypothetical protein
MARDRMAFRTRLWQMEDAVLEMANAIKIAISGDLLAKVLAQKSVVTLPVELSQARARLGIVVCELSEPVPQLVP